MRLRVVGPSPDPAARPRRPCATYNSPQDFRVPYGDYGQIAIDSDGDTQATWGKSRSYIGPGSSSCARGL